MRIDVDSLAPCTEIANQWFYVILDEAQKIKNWKSQVYTAA